MKILKRLPEVDWFQLVIVLIAVIMVLLVAGAPQGYGG